MNVKELLKQEKGKYDERITYYEEYQKHMPFYLEWEVADKDMKVVDYFYQTKKWKNGKTTKNLVIIWERY